MLSYDDIAAAGEERDALYRALTEDLMAGADARRDEPELVRASRPAHVARALGRGRRRPQTGRPRSAA